MAKPQTWVFTQIGGDQKRLQLSGWSAPFGRPRKSTIVNAGVAIRKQVTYYPGGNVPPTVHSFGKMGKPWELRGRWMDAALALSGGAQAYARSWKDFIEDEREVRAVWGAILSYRIFIHDLDLNFESDSELAWVMQCDVLQDEGSQIVLKDEPRKAPFDMATAIGAELSQVTNITSTKTFGSILNLLPDLVDDLDALVTAVNTPFATVYNACAALTDFETASTAELGKLGGGIQSLKTGVLNLRSATYSITSGALLAGSPLDLAVGDQAIGRILSGPDVLSLTAAKIACDASTRNLLALIAEMQDSIDLAVRGSATTAHVAQDGDSWERIAIRTLGSPSAARTIRDANGVRYGAKPTPGRTYIIPRTA